MIQGVPQCCARFRFFDFSVPGGLGIRPWHFSAVHLGWILGGVCAGWAVEGWPGGLLAPEGPGVRGEGVGAVVWDTL